ncbi:MAG: class I SAM-dependent methyltransferase [Desulfovibrionaceae bacterium]|nr:class I SAM-dependent methyltransferase [Desulfovibrionaceae bacterium]MBF0514704.1 class I SAM-dependent methyltransferase [Desulfovibrionaceae bacterium]
MGKSLSIYNDLHKSVRDETDFFNRWITFYLEKFDAATKAVIENGVCLDAGCGGTGKGTLLINELKPARLLSMDINRTHSLQYKNIPATRFICGDLLQIPFPDQTFDFILCNGVAHHTPDPVAAIRDLVRILKPGGILHISVYCFRNSLFDWSVKVMRALGTVVPFKVANKLFGSNFNMSVLLDHAYVPYEFVYGREEFRALLSASGLDFQDVVNPSSSYLKEKSFAGFLARNERCLFGDGAILYFMCRKK